MAIRYLWVLLVQIMVPILLPIWEQVSSPFSAQMLELCESESFLETIQNKHFYQEEFSYTTNPSFQFQSYINKYTTLSTPTRRTTSTFATTIDKFSLILEKDITKNDISTPLGIRNASYYNSHQYPFSTEDQSDLSILLQQIPPTTDNNTIVNNSVFSYPPALSNDHLIPIEEPTTLQNVCEENYLPFMPQSKLKRLSSPLSPNYSFIDPFIHSYLPLFVEHCGIFNKNFFAGNDIQPRKYASQGDNYDIFGSDPLPHSYNSHELEALRLENQHLVNGDASFTTPIISLEPETYIATNKLTSEERKEKIHRYMKKRNKRNYSKKIKYVCRKTLADNRPRVKGRFTKNDEFGESDRTNIDHEEHADENIRYIHANMQYITDYFINE